MANRPVERKVRYSAVASALTVVVTSLLATYFHTHLPPELVALLPATFSVIIGGVVAYLTKHDPKLLELIESAAGEQK